VDLRSCDDAKCFTTQARPIRFREDIAKITKRSSNCNLKIFLKSKTRVVEFICDFEKAVWQSGHIVFSEGAKIFGYGLH
jgi:hypothetical protein